MLLVRKPKDPKAFSGVVMFETMHAAGATPMWGNGRNLLGEGHGYAMVVSQKHSLDTHVKPSDPERYASLGIAVPQESIPTSEAAAAAAPVDMPAEMRRQMSVLEAQSASSNAIMSHAGALLKSNLPSGPFAGMGVTHIVMGGASQTGGTTLGYIRNAHASARLADGAPVFDGFMPMAAGGTEPIPPCDVPVIHALGEGDMMGGRPLGYRRPDADGSDDFYRLYELTAVSHVPTRGIEGPGADLPAPRRRRLARRRPQPDPEPDALHDGACTT